MLPGSRSQPGEWLSEDSPCAGCPLEQNDVEIHCRVEDENYLLSCRYFEMKLWFLEAQLILLRWATAEWCKDTSRKGKMSPMTIVSNQHLRQEHHIIFQIDTRFGKLNLNLNIVVSSCFIHFSRWSLRVFHLSFPSS